VGDWLKLGWHAAPEMLRVENNFTNAASEFVTTPKDAAQASDFALKPGSAHWKSGFQKIPLEEIGLQPKPHDEGF
jgi:hypothetical protein